MRLTLAALAIAAALIAAAHGWLRAPELEAAEIRTVADLMNRLPDPASD